MFGDKKIHIVSFDVPLPADYGGAIDVYVRLKALSLAGYDIHFHCFDYGRGKSTELESLVGKVSYYNRRSLFLSLFSLKPMIVKSRESKELLHNLLKDNHPIFFEAQHTTAFLGHEALKSRLKVVRTHNVEHHYYKGLALSERNWFKKVFFHLESYKLKNHENIFQQASVLCAISKKDKFYYDKIHPEVVLLPIANELLFDESYNLKQYVLFHGNLSVSENEYALSWFLNGFVDDLPFKLFVAGKSASKSLKEKLKRYQSIEFVDSPSDEKMKQLVYEAKAHLMLTFQSTGVKQKLINVLASKGEVIVNPMMVDGTELAKYCITGDTHEELMQIVIKALNNDTLVSNLEERHEILQKQFGLIKQSEVIGTCFKSN